jgi:hypothetical protein
MTSSVLLTVLLSLPAWHGERELADVDRRALLAPVAEAIHGAARSREEAAALITQAWHESRLAAYVLEGRCHEGPPGARCDMDRKGNPRARGPWQVWSWCKAWDYPEGSRESLRHEASCAVRAMRFHLKRCETWEGAFAGLRRSKCVSSRSKARVETMKLVLGRLYSASR